VILKSANPFRPLVVHRNFRLFWSGQTLSLVGTWMQTVAQGWLALELSNSAFVVGVVSAAQAFPILLLSLYAGVIADRYNKFKLIMIGQGLFFLQSALLWWFVATGHVTIGWLITLAAFNGIVSAFETPVRQSFIVELVGREDLVEAIALNSGGFNLARIIGPSIAALVIGTLGLQWCFAFNALSYFVVIVWFLMMRLPPWKPVVQGLSPLEGLKEGLRYMRRTPEVSVLIRVVATYSIFGMPFISMMPVVARNVLQTDAAGYGFLLTCVGIGALTGALTLAALGYRVPRGRLYMASAYTFPSLLIIFSFIRSLPIAAAILLLIGFTMILNSALANALLQSIVPDELRGRVVSAYVFVYLGFTPIGSFAMGAFAKMTNVQIAIAMSATIMLLYAAWTFFRHPDLRSV
jgi:MFS family permease